jgi:predicted transcriptional regulator
MNDGIRAAVVARLDDKHMSRADLARAVGKTPQEITRALNGGKDGGGKVPGIWVAIFEALDLELTAQLRQGTSSEEKTS